MKTHHSSGADKPLYMLSVEPNTGGAINEDANADEPEESGAIVEDYIKRDGSVAV